MTKAKLGFPASFALILFLGGPLWAQSAPSNHTFDATDGVKVHATFYSPKIEDKKEGYAAVILLHMLNRTKADWKAFATRLQKEGYCVLAIDLRGHGKSVIKKGQQIAWRDFSKDDFNAMTKDVKAAQKWLTNLTYIDSTRIAVIGGSIGANVALNYGAENEDIAGVGLLSAGKDYRGVATYDAADKYADRPIFIAASRDDGQCVKDAETIAGKCKSNVLKIYTSAGHGTRMFGKEDKKGDLEKSLLKWLKETLKTKK